MDIKKNRTMTGLLQDGKDLNRGLSSAISQLTAHVGVLSEMFPYLKAKSSEAGTFVPVAYLLEGFDKFQTQLELLRAQVLIMDQLENLRSNDATEKAAAIAYFDSLNSGKTFTDRYK